MISILIEGMTCNKGGKESYIVNIFKAFDRKKYQFTFVAYDEEIAYEKYLQENGATIIHLPSRNEGFFRFRKALNNLLKQNKYDVVWAHKTTLSSCEILELAKKNGVPLRIVHSHSSSNMGSKLTYVLHITNKTCLPLWANMFFACSQTAATWFFGDKDCIIAKNGIDIQKFKYNKEIRNKIREQYSIGDCFVLGHIGRFGKEKNHKKLIDVFYEVKKRKNNAKLVLCGDGEERNNIIQQIQKLNLQNDVLLLGVVNNVNDILQGIDLIVMPSLFEGLPFSLLEAQAAGLKCVVSDTVSKESDIMKWNTFIALEEEDSYWAEEICNIELEYDRFAAIETMQQEGYDIHKCVREIDTIISTGLQSVR